MKDRQKWDSALVAHLSAHFLERELVRGFSNVSAVTRDGEQITIVTDDNGEIRNFRLTVAEVPRTGLSLAE